MSRYRQSLGRPLALIAALALPAALIPALRRRRGEREPRSWLAGGDIHVFDLGAELRGLGDQGRAALSDEAKPSWRQRIRFGRRSETGPSAAESAKPRSFVLRFEGDIKATAVERLRHEITALLQIARPQDRVVLMLDSPGGTVTGYGLAAAQLERIRAKGLDPTVSIDRVAASGGYLMAAAGNTIVAAPLALVGSIGVIVGVPNFNRTLERLGVDFEQHTAGEHKRTVTMFGATTEAEREQLRAELKAVHELFKASVRRCRPDLDVEQVATGQAWYAADTMNSELGLVDRLMTGDELLLERAREGELFELRFHAPEPRGKGLARLLGYVVAHAAWETLAVLRERPRA